MKLTREQELKLIDLGFQYLLSFHTTESHSEMSVEKSNGKPKRKWTPEQRRKFRATMKAKRVTSAQK